MSEPPPGQEPPPGRLSRLPGRGPKLPSEQDWERAALLEPSPAPREAELLSDGGGLPFPRAALTGPPKPLDPEDPAAKALLAFVVDRFGPSGGSKMPWKKRGADQPPPPTLAGWRQLARTDEEVLFGHGQPPQLLTVAFRAARRGKWTLSAASSAQPLLATRDRIRASSWRIDPTHEADPGDTVLRVLVTEQAVASGKGANGRVLAPDIHIGPDELVLRMFVTPRPGYQSGSPNPETPVRVALPQPLGERRLVDGARAEFAAPEPATDEPDPAGSERP